jgi:hypothetical protein
LILALAAGSSSGQGSNNGSRYEANKPEQMTPQSMQEAFRDAQREMQKMFDQGIPDLDITGRELTTFLWVIGGFVLVMFLFGIAMAVARYVSETAVIRMVDEYEGTGNKMTIREGFRIGWSKTAWRLFLINLIVNLPLITLILVLIVAGGMVFVSVVNGNASFAAFSIVTAIALFFLTIFVVVILSVLLRLLRNFFWRIAVLENAGVRESLQRGFALVLEQWKNVGLMWLVMIGLGIVWIFASFILIIVTIPVVLVTAAIAILIVALPYLLLVGIFSTFLGGFLPWVAAGLFIMPLFFPLAFAPWVLLGSWQSVYTSTVWTLTYREIKALPAPALEPIVQPAGD